MFLSKWQLSEEWFVYEYIKKKFSTFVASEYCSIRIVLGHRNGLLIKICFPRYLLRGGTSLYNKNSTEKQILFFPNGIFAFKKNLRWISTPDCNLQLSAQSTSQINHRNKDW